MEYGPPVHVQWGSIFNLTTALESSAEVPEMEVVTERLLHAERKITERDGDRDMTGRCFPNVERVLNAITVESLGTSGKTA